MSYPQQILDNVAIGGDRGLLRLVSAMVRPRGLEAEPERDDKVLVRLGNRSALRFSNDRGRIFISAGSLDHSDSFFAMGIMYESGETPSHTVLAQRTAQPPTLACRRERLSPHFPPDIHRLAS